MSEHDNGNGRITLAVLGVKLDNIEELVKSVVQRLDKIDDQQEADCRRIDRIENTVSVLKWVLGPVGAVVIALVIDWLTKALT